MFANFLRYSFSHYLATMFKHIIFISLVFIVLVLTKASFGQVKRISPPQMFTLAQQDDSLGTLGVQILDDPDPLNRLRADSLFTRVLVRALRTPYSFDFIFDSIKTAPILYPPDSTFRIITWHYTLNDADYRQRGALQMKTADGSLQLFPLFDKSEDTEVPEDSVRDNRNWIGALYYKIIQTAWQGKNYYSLLGYDLNNSVTARKWIDVLSFNEKGEPRWGGRFFRVNNQAVFSNQQKRFLLEYKAGSRARLNYDDEEKMIIFDALISETNEPQKKYTLVPSGDYKGFVWKEGFWDYIDQLSNTFLGDGNEPKPALILDAQGNANENALQQQSDKNMQEKKPPAKPIPAKPKKKGQ